MRRTRPIMVSAAGVGAVCLLLSGCMRTRLVEQFENGPVGGTPGPSEGYWWVGDAELVPCGKGWKDTDRASLTPEQVARIRNWRMLWR